MADPKQSRGYRNKNPGNIDFVPANKWQGQVGKEPGGRFAVFSSHEFGIRALASLLTTYQDRYGLRTPKQIINKWAPPVENQTNAYAAAVAKDMGIGVDTQIDVHLFRDLQPLVKAIIKHELGGQPYSDDTINAGLALMGVTAPVQTVTQAAATGTGRGVIAGAGVVGMASVATQIAPAITALNGLDWRVGALIVVVAAVGVVAWVLNNRKKEAPISPAIDTEVPPEVAK